MFVPYTPVLGFEPRSRAPEALMLSRLHHTGMHSFCEFHQSCPCRVVKPCDGVGEPFVSSYALPSDGGKSPGGSDHAWCDDDQNYG